MRAALLAAVLLCAPAVRAEQTCAELLDGGVEPPPVTLLPKGTVLDQDSYVATPARMCRIGDKLADCEGVPFRTVVTLMTGTAVVVAGVVLASLAASGHIK